MIIKVENTVVSATPENEVDAILVMEFIHRATGFKPKREVGTEVPKKKMKCGYCHKTDHVSADCKKPYALHRQVKKLNCAKCGRKCMGLRGLQIHMSRHRKAERVGVPFPKPNPEEPPKAPTLLERLSKGGLA